MILLSSLSVIRHLICKTLWTGLRSGLLISILSIDVKMDGFVLEEKCFKMLGLTFSSKLDWGSCIISIAKTASKKIGALIRL